jgi:hypothetical protein
MGCQSYSISDWHDDQEICAEHELYYKHASCGFGTDGTKLDFYSRDIRGSAELDSMANDNYLGYVVLRPTPVRRICEAVIRPPYGDAVRSGATHYVLAKATYESQVAGRTLYVDASPFVQQDSHVGVCSHACLLSISSLTSRMFPGEGPGRLTLREITDAVSRVTPFPVIQRGLVPAHVSKAFEAMGLAGDAMYVFGGKEQVFTGEQVAYIYAESGLPVFVGLPLNERGGHSVVVVGHTYEPDAWWPEAFPEYYQSIPSGEGWLSSAAWTGHFIIHDDNFGPYMAMPKHVTAVSWVAVPLPRYILIKGDAAELLAFWALRNPLVAHLVDKALGQNLTPWTARFAAHLSAGRVVLRTILMSHDEFVRSLSKLEGAQEELMELFSKVALPKHLWLVEVSIPEIYGSGYRLGEVVLDASYPPNFIREGYEPIALVHVPGVLVLYQPGDTPPDAYLVRGDAHYGFVDRHKA